MTTRTLHHQLREGVMRRLRPVIQHRGARGVWRGSLTLRWLEWIGSRVPRAADALQLAGLMHLSEGRHREAIARFEEALARGLGERPFLRFNLALAHMSTGALACAERELHEAARLAPQAPWITYHVALCLMRQGRTDDAVAAFVTSLEQSADTTDGQQRDFPEVLARAASGDAAQVEALHALVQRRPQAVAAARFLAHVEAHRGNAAVATELLEHVGSYRWPRPIHGDTSDRMPHFLVIGQAKAGTTSLFQYLGAHAQVEMPLEKEMHYWSWHHRHGAAWYRAHFPPLPEMLARPLSGTSRRITGEASPSYFTHPEAPARIASALPGVRCILLLRDPVARAYSDYRMQVQPGHLSASFEEIMAAELARTPRCPLEPDAVPNGILTHSAALPHLKRWLRYLPAEQLLVVRTSDLADDLPGVMRRVCRHLDIAPFVPPDRQRHNEGRYPALSSALEQQLRAWFAEHDRALADFLTALPATPS
jgi:tetratricopeptide (TPR) repeat protein